MTICPESQFMLTPSEVLEHVFCPRFTYFMPCLRISQQEHKRYKVMKGRKLHEKRSRDNPGFTRKRVGCVKRLTDVYLASPQLHVRGTVDEILELEDGSLAPLDYKMTRAREKPFKTHRMQLVLYGLLIAETYDRPVKRGFIVYTVGGNHVSTIEFNNRDFQKARKIMVEITDTIEKGALPKRTRCQTRCLDCCYRNICV
jgi:CRISPR-associated exonuclease Cas4